MISKIFMVISFALISINIFVPGFIPLVVLGISSAIAAIALATSQ